MKKEYQVYQAKKIKRDTMKNENSAKKNLNFVRIAKRNMNFWADQKNTKLSLTLELINNVFADLPI